MKQTETRITVRRSNLEQALSIVGAAAATSSPVPILQYVLFAFSQESGITLRATDTNVYMEGRLDAEGEGACEIAVPPKRLGAILGSLTREEIEITHRESEGGNVALQFVAGRQKASLPGLPGEDFLDLPNALPIHRFVLPAQALKEAIRRGGHAALKKADTEIDKRWNCLCVSADMGRLRLNSSDGIRFAQMIVPVESCEFLSGNVLGEDGAENGKKRRGKAVGEPMLHRKADAAMIPLAEVWRAVRLLDAAGEGSATLEIGWRLAALSAGNYRAVLPVMDQPNFAEGIVKLIDRRRAGGFKSNCTIDRNDLLRAVKAAKAALPTEGMLHQTLDGIAVMLWPNEDGDGTSLHLTTGDRGGSGYSDVLPAEIDLADHFEALKARYLAEALASAATEKITLRFAPLEERGNPLGQRETFPGPMFVEELWGEDDASENRPEWLAVIQPQSHDPGSVLFRALVGDWEAISGRPWSLPPMVGQATDDVPAVPDDEDEESEFAEGEEEFPEPVNTEPEPAGV